jgi:hypothetical protein
MQAAGDAGEDLRDIDGAEAAPDSVGFGEGAPSDRGGELPAVFDELADEVEQAPRAARLGGRVRDVGHGGHERNKNMKRGRVARNIFCIAQGIKGLSGAWPLQKRPESLSDWHSLVRPRGMTFRAAAVFQFRLTVEIMPVLSIPGFVN